MQRPCSLCTNSHLRVEVCFASGCKYLLAPRSTAVLVKCWFKAENRVALSSSTKAWMMQPNERLIRGHERADLCDAALVYPLLWDPI